MVLRIVGQDPEGAVGGHGAGDRVVSLGPQSIALRELDVADLAGGRKMGRQVLEALGFDTGFTHMEWYKKADGEVVFGEIGGRAPGARIVDIINYCTDDDAFVGWAEAVTLGHVTRRFERQWNVVITFKRAQGQGHIRRIVGLEKLLAEFGRHVVEVDLTPIGAPRRNWKQTLIGDGYIVVRHPELSPALQMSERIAREVQLYAG